jgi:hypothetical protein
VKLNNTLDAKFKDCAIRCYKRSLSLFGYGTDLRIYETSSPFKSYTYLGSTFEIPPGYDK